MESPITVKFEPCPPYVKQLARTGCRFATQERCRPCFFNNLRPIRCTLGPLNPNFRRFPAFHVPEGGRSDSIIVTHSTHRNFQVSTWKVLCKTGVPLLREMGMRLKGKF